MAIVTKTIRGRGYAYSLTREGKRVITKYIGPAGSARALKAINESKSKNAVPDAFSPLFWDTDIKNIDLRDNARYVISRVLQYGGLDALEWIQRIYTVRKILDAVETSRAMDVRSRSFWRLWFGAEAA